MMAICTGTLPAALPRASASAILSMRDRPASRQAWTTRPCFPLHHSRVRWGAAMKRTITTCRIVTGIGGLRDLVALTAYPAPESAKKAVGRMMRWAAHGHHHYFGSWHPNAPRPDNKTYPDYAFGRDRLDGYKPRLDTSRMDTIAYKFESGVYAGGAFLSFLSLKMGDAEGVGWEWSNRPDKTLLQSGQRPTDEFSSAEDKGRYRREWGKWARTSHIGAAFYALLNAQDYVSNMKPNEFCRNLLEQVQADELPHNIVAAANGFREYAMKHELFPKIRDPFIRLIAV
jgi:hypothetical protein